jgi:hypothetical protein
MGATPKMLDIPFKTKLMQKISPSFLSYAKCPFTPPLGNKSPAPHFSRDLISFSCRLLKNMPQNQSFVSNCIGALECADIVPRAAPPTGASGEAAFAEHIVPEGF